MIKNLIIRMAALSTLILYCVVTFPNGIARQAPSDTVTIDLAQRNIDINVSFKGAKFTLFGVIGEDNNTTSHSQTSSMPHIIAMIKGPSKNISIRPIEQSGLIYIPGQSTIIRDIPTLYFISSSTELSTILPEKQQIEYGFDLKNLKFFLDDNPTTYADDKIRNAIVETAQKDGLYAIKAHSVRFLENGLFSFELSLPKQTPVGDYSIEVTAWRNGTLIGQDSAKLTVKKTGIERQIYEIAHQYSFIYGVLCVLLSLLAGWVVSVIFRRS